MEENSIHSWPVPQPEHISALIRGETENVSNVAIQVYNTFNGRMSVDIMKELINYSEIYYISPKELDSMRQFKKVVTSFLTVEGTYLCERGDQIAFRYQILSYLGNGKYSVVYRAFDHKVQESVVLKILRNLHSSFCFRHHRYCELEILEYLREIERTRSRPVNVNHLIDSFTFRDHLVMTFQCYDLTLRQVMERPSILECKYIREIIRSVIEGLAVFEDIGLIHADLKPSNIMLRNKSGRTEITIIDVGMSYFKDTSNYRGLPAKCYRAPEAILREEIGHGLDMWALASFIVEMLIRRKLFPVNNEQDILLMQMELFGLPPSSILQKSEIGRVLLDRQGIPKVFKGKRFYLTPEQVKIGCPGTKRLPDFLRQFCSCKELIEFLKCILVMNPSRRLTAKNALRHYFLATFPQLNEIFI